MGRVGGIESRNDVKQVRIKGITMTPVLRTSREVEAERSVRRKLYQSR